jgi:hypothetical protein
MNSKAEWYQPAVGRVVVLQELQELSGSEGRRGRERGRAEERSSLEQQRRSQADTFKL